MLGAFALCMGLLVSPVQAEKFVVGFQPYDTISYQAIINAELGLWKKYTPEGTEIEFHPAVQGTVVASNMLADRAQIGYMSIMPAAVLCVRAKGKVKMVSTTDMSEGTRCSLILVRKDAPDFKDNEALARWLDGKVIAAPKGSASDQYMRRFFEKYNEFNKGRKTLEKHDQYKQIMADAVFTYDKVFSDKHTLNAMIGMNYTQDDTYKLKGTGSEAPTDYVPTLAPTKPDLQRTTSSLDKEVLVGFFARVNYDYKRRYLLTVSARYDGASQFAEDHKFALFPAVSGGWNMHYEDWFPKTVVSRMKLRASWGQTGNNKLSYSNTQGEYASYIYAGNPGVLNSVLANNSLVWETTSNVDYGFDAGFFDNRLELSVTGYNKLTSDRLYDKALPAQTGFSSIKANLGTVQNKGFELSLTAHPLSTTSPVSWDVTGTFSMNRTYMKKLPYNGRDKNRVQGGLVWDAKSGTYVETGGLAEGERIGGRWGYKYLGVYDTDEEAAKAPVDTKVSGSKMNKKKVAGDAIWADLDNNGVIDDKDITFIGWANPDKKGALINNLSYKNFSLRLVVDFALGHSIANIWRCRANANARNAIITTTDVTNGNIWWQTGDAATAKYPRYDVASDWDNGYRNHMRTIAYAGMNSNGNADNTAYYSKGDYLCFREVSLGYELPRSVCSKMKVKGVSLNAGVTNIGYITAFDGLNPEQYDGQETGEYFLPIQFNFGVRLTF